MNLGHPEVFAAALSMLIDNRDVRAEARAEFATTDKALGGVEDAVAGRILAGALTRVRPGLAFRDAQRRVWKVIASPSRCAPPPEQPAPKPVLGRDLYRAQRKDDVKKGKVRRRPVGKL